MKIVFVILILVLVLSGVGYFYYQNQLLTDESADLQSKIEVKGIEIANLRDEKAGVERELAVWKATDFDKEAKLLRLKLDAVEKGLAAAGKKAAKLKMNFIKMKPYSDTLAAVDFFFGRPMTNSNLNNIDVKIDILNDSQINAQWKEARADINVNQNIWGTNGIVHTLFLIVSKIRGLAL